MSRSEQPPSTPPGRSASATEDRSPKLWVELVVDIAASRDCPLNSGHSTGVNGSVQLVGSTCHLTLGSDHRAANETRTISTQVTDRCLCPDLCADGFSPVDLSVERGSLVIGAHVTDRRTLSEVTGRLDEGVEEWRLQQLTTTSNEESLPGTVRGHEQLTLTEKQREAVQIAVDMGYYDRPRGASLGDLADEIGVTRSALSQRLNTVESKLITDLSRNL